MVLRQVYLAGGWIDLLGSLVGEEGERVSVRVGAGQRVVHVDLSKRG